MEQSMYDKLLSLPLFQGLGQNDLTRILESTHLTFETAVPQTVLVRQDDLCNTVVFVMDGDIEFSTQSADHSWSVTEHLPAPMAIGLDSLYGSSRVYQATCTTATSAHILCVDKRTIAALTGYFEVFRINVLNALSTLSARQRQLQWMPAPATLEGRIVRFLRHHVQRPAGNKHFDITLRILGAYLGEDYRYVSRALHALQDKGLLRLGRRFIEVPAFENIIKETL